MSRQILGASEETISPGHRLRRARECLQVSQSQMAKRLGWHWKKVQALEASRQKLTMEIAAQLQQAWGISAAWLLQGKEPMMAPPPLRESSPNGEIPMEPPELYEVIQNLSGRATIVTAEELGWIHRLLRVLRSEDPGLIQAATANLLQLERLSRLLNARFGDIILLERRSQPRTGSHMPRRRTSDDTNS